MKLNRLITATPSKGKNKSVVKQLKENTLKLTEAEATIKLLSRMVRTGIATNDVYSFVRNQCKLRKASNKLDHRLIKSTMRQKLNDACAFASRLRQAKGRLRQSLILKHNCNKTRATKYLDRLKKEASDHSMKCNKKNERKFQHCKKKAGRRIEV